MGGSDTSTSKSAVATRRPGSPRQRWTRRASRARGAIGARGAQWGARVVALVAAVGLAGGVMTTSALANASAPAPADPMHDVGVVTPATAPAGGPDGSARGLVDAHAHLTAGVAFGGAMRCGRPFHEAGLAAALADCPPHSGFGHGAILETILDGSDFPMGTQGYPDFTDWPAHNTLLHEQAHHHGIERAYRGGLRVLNNYLVENRVICELFPAAEKTACDEMDSIRLQADYLRQMEAHIDDLHGGPGEGWFRIATSPEQARQIIADDKLAVTMGVEISEPFGCRVIHGEPQCTRDDIDRGLDEFQEMGVATVFPIHKFDNALGGTRFDAGFSGAAVNIGNALSTGRLWQTEPCTGEASDNEQPLISDEVHEILGGGSVGLPPGTAIPVYPAGPQCNVNGLSELGEHAVNGLIDRGMMINIDHMSVKTAEATLDITAERDYAGIVTDHTWSDPSIIHRIRDAGGFLSSYAFASHDHGDDDGFVDDWRKNTDGVPVPGYGFGSDVNGLAPQAPPRDDAGVDPLHYPFTAPNGAVMDRHRVGNRVYDINDDGVAQYGLYADWFADVLHKAGPDRDRLADELMNGAEHYLSLWTSVR